MTYKLYLDDCRECPDEWEIARTSHDAKALVITKGIPTHLSLDHDLGMQSDNGYEFLKWLIEYDLDNDIVTLEIPKIYFHSSNPPGKENMSQLWESYLNFKFNADTDFSIDDST